MSASINISQRGIRRAASARRKRVGVARPFQTRRPNVFVPRQPIAAIVRRQVARMGEKKFFDQSLATATTNAWAIILASAVALGQGQTVETRIGDKLNLISFNFRMFLSMNALEAQVTPSPVILTRIIIGVSHVGVIGATTDVVDTGSTSDLLSYYQNTTISDFTILKDFFIKVDPHALNEGAVDSFAHGTSISDVVKFTHTFKKPLQLRFGAGTTNVTQNSIFILAVSSSTGGIQNIETRARYSDA